MRSGMPVRACQNVPNPASFLGHARIHAFGHARTHAFSWPQLRHALFLWPSSGPGPETASIPRRLGPAANYNWGPNYWPSSLYMLPSVVFRLRLPGWLVLGERWALPVQIVIYPHHWDSGTVDRLLPL